MFINAFQLYEFKEEDTIIKNNSDKNYININNDTNNESPNNKIIFANSEKSENNKINHKKKKEDNGIEYTKINPFQN